MGEFFVVAAFTGTLLFLLPVFLRTDVYLDLFENRAWFSVYLYGFIKLFGGYAELNREGIAVHVTKKKAFFIFYNKMGDTRKQFEITQGFQLWRHHQIIETGGVNTPVTPLAASFIQSASGAVCSYLQTRYPFISLKNSMLVTENASFKLTTQTTVVFNLLVVVIAITKKILEAIINWIRKKRSIRYSKKLLRN